MFNNFLDDFWNVCKEENLFGGNVENLENWKILDLKVVEN